MSLRNYTIANMKSFADSVANLCVEKYNTLKKTGKPTDNEWTVLSGIVMKNIDDTLSLIALATGTKCLGESELITTPEHEKGCKLSDSHAEVLVRRSFLRYLYDQIDLTVTGYKSPVFSINDKRKLNINDGVSFHFFSSQTPCGDCSIFPKNICDDAPPIKIRKLDDEKDTSDLFIHINRDIYRTGAKCVKTEEKQDPKLPGVNYHVVGPLRTKPGRGDPTLSLSCSDKMAKWNFLGIQGSLLSLLIPPIKLESIIIGGDCPFSLEAMERGLYKRFNDNRVYVPKIMQAAVSFAQKKTDKRLRPCPSSIIWCAVREREIEIAVGGRKQGVTKKKKKGSNLAVSRRGLFETFLRICDKYQNFESWKTHPKKITYYDCKQWSQQYQNLWTQLKSDIFHAWPSKPLELQKFVL